MHKLIFFTLSIFIISCSSVKSQKDQKYSLEATAFYEKIKSLPGVTILDVRSPEEYAGGHLDHSVNTNWNGNSFEEETAGLDKSKPVMVYCLSGGRSSSAASFLRNKGFSEVYEMQGGMMAWRSAGLPESTVAVKKQDEISQAQFNGETQSAPLILVDFYAEWCAPCKKMKPWMDELEHEMQGKLKVVRINVDKNKTLCTQMKIKEIPVLQIYKNGVKTWEHSGLAEKKQVADQLH